MPCRLNCLPASLAMSRSTTARKSSSASSTTTSEPRRFQTLPSSRPITPAPTTPSFFGTCVEFERAPGVDDALAVERRDLQLDGRRAASPE